MKERVSALLDGALDQAASRQILDALGKDDELRGKWDAYCLIGDVLRSEHDALPPDFSSTVLSRLSDEPAVVAPIIRPGGQSVIRHLMPLAASAMGMAAVGWVALNLTGATKVGQEPLVAKAAVAQGAVLASSERQPTSTEGPSAKPADRASAEKGTSEREYLFAHQAMTPSNPIPGVALYVRTVSDYLPNGNR